MTHHSAITTIERIGSMWRVCTNGVCREHRQEWQAKVYYHQMINNPTVCADDQHECLDE
jgi:hypothetical protein